VLALRVTACCSEDGHTGVAAAAGVRAFPGLIGMVLANPARVFAASTIRTRRRHPGSEARHNKDVYLHGHGSLLSTTILEKETRFKMILAQKT
jgi:hypothetical protein